ncbi:MAG: hypothetical protein QHJ34_03600 [bacterium]|jgi:hypothetical protein|nr:hypothetical protein [candidate division KSB1 bacterium]MDH7559299.1 hypothetical protein [bacterium]
MQEDAERCFPEEPSSARPAASRAIAAYRRNDAPPPAVIIDLRKAPPEQTGLDEAIEAAKPAAIVSISPTNR